MRGRLRFAPHLRPFAVGADRLLLVGDGDEVLLRGRYYAALAPLLDGTRTADVIVAALASLMLPAETLFALTLLHDRGWVVESDPGLQPEADAFWHSTGVDARQAAARLAETPVAVEAAPGSEQRLVIEALAEAGVRVEAGARLRVAVTDDYLESSVESLARRARDERFDWIPLQLRGRAARMGPIFRGAASGDRPCWACLAQRIRAHRPAEAWLQRAGLSGAPLSRPQAPLPAAARTAAAFAGVAIARWIALGGRGDLDDHVMAIDWRTLACERHRVVRRPQCPACGDPGLVARRGSAPPVLQPQRALAAADGGHRTVAPEETFERHRHHVSPITGVLSNLEPVPGRHHPLRPTWSALLPLPPDGRTELDEGFRRLALGKGRTSEQARVSALCEGIERVSAFFQGDEPRVRARLEELGGAGVHPHDLLLFSEAQMAARQAWNEGAADRRRRVPPPFDERRIIEWTPAWPLFSDGRDERPRYLPTALCYDRYPSAPEDEIGPFSSNGHAAGNCLEEAILQGLLELVERDAVAIWWHNRLCRPGIDLASFADPDIERWAAHHHARGGALRVLDVTSDLGIPACVAIVEAGAGGVYLGFGCHLDARVAVQRALSELNQLADPEERRPAPLDLRALVDRSFTWPDARAPLRARADFPDTPGDGDLLCALRSCVGRAAAAGLDVLVVDQTRPDLELPVVKVVAPGLRHPWPRFAPGRLYEVPVRMRWREQPCPEEQLNPIPMVI
ncbi:TOMM precursor leader peptide-binding protein [Sorangium sp. So ce542]|uniref:TOMM precursor leader peptide-binding protein n=1 Tax=Sorangium sp. So ce542 TaxID=3133316 RepID=UPI003F5FB43D